MELILYQVDAFTDTVFRGNPAAVCPLQQWPSDEQMQAIALENNLSETAFFIQEGGAFHLRWFTPAKEVSLCGHATLATAHVLFQHLDYRERRVTFHSLSGPLMVEQRDGWYYMNFPTDPPVLVPTPKTIDAALDLHPVETYKGKDDYLVILESQEAVEQIQPDFRRLRQLDGRGVIITAPGRSTDIASRCFYPKYGIDEDPVTGSAHTTLGPYWANRLDKSRLTALQCSPRTGLLQLRLMDERIEIAGQAVTFMEGKIRF